ncbi:MAG TPA: M28 family peptidase, partial [Fimbriimonadaceae bacterium]|nr:M28 family peptidase [Fimbriimonadaceae bacterium]
VHFKGKTLHRNILTLGGLGLLAAFAAFAISQKSPQGPPTTVAPSKATVEFDKSKAWAHLVKQCSVGPRNPGSKGYDATKDYLVAEMKKYCDEVRLQPFTHTWSSTGKPVAMANVIGEQNYKSAKTRILLLAHWDTRPTSDQDFNQANSNKPIMGANDGASGVAVLLELMRAVKGRLPKDVGVMYLMTDGEDLGPDLDEMFLGAREFAKKFPSPKPDYGILLDMIGDKNLKVPMEPNSSRFAGALLKAFYLNAQQNGLRETFPMNFGPIIEDDHIPLNEAGLPTIDLIDFDYAAWHTQQDTVDKCSADSLGKIGTALETWLLKDPAYRVGGN